MLFTQNLTVTYPLEEKPSLKNICLQMEAGSIGLLVGDNGSGKSTLLHCLAGLIPGIIRADVHGNYNVKGTVGMALQDSDVFLLSTPREELDFVLQNQGLPLHQRQQKIEQYLSLFQISSLLNRSIHTLSGGERQRLALAAAMATEPQILLLDEPLAQLDNSFSAHLTQCLQKLASGGTSILIATTSGTGYEALDAIYYWLSNGEIIWKGHKQEFTKKWNSSSGGRIDFNVNRPVAGNNELKLTCHNKSRYNSSNPSPVLSLEGVSYSYDKIPFLQDVNLTIMQGEFTALTGPNGSGKSTLLKLAAGILKPHQGFVRVMGKNIAGKSIAEATTESGFLFQNPDHQIFQNKVIKEITWGLKMRKFDPDLIPVQTEYWLKQLQMEHMAEEHPYSLTKTDRQWVALAGVLAREPSLLLLDEPTHGMDYVSTDRFMKVIMELARTGTAILMVTHHQALANQYAHRIYNMDQGICTPR